MVDTATSHTYRMRIPRWVWIVFAVGLAICVGASVWLLFRLVGVGRGMSEDLTAAGLPAISPLRDLWWIALQPLGMELLPTIVVVVLWRRQRHEFVRLTDDGIVFHKAFGRERVTPWVEVDELRAQLFGFSKNPAVMVYSGGKRIAVAGHDYPERAELLAEVTARAGLTEVDEDGALTTHTRPT